MKTWLLLVTLFDVSGTRLENVTVDGFTTKEKCGQAGPRMSAYLLRGRTNVAKTESVCVELEK